MEEQETRLCLAIYRRSRVHNPLKCSSEICLTQETPYRTRKTTEWTNDDIQGQPVHNCNVQESSIPWAS